MTSANAAPVVDTTEALGGTGSAAVATALAGEDSTGIASGVTVRPPDFTGVTDGAATGPVGSSTRGAVGGAGGGAAAAGAPGGSGRASPASARANTPPA